MPGRILSDRKEALLAEERRHLGALQAALARADASREDQGTLEASIRQLDELFLLVVVGEFNAGKSTFINALLGRELLPEGVTPTTTRIHRLRYGEVEERRIAEGEIEEIAAPLEALRELQIVDTPGTNALERRHEAISEEFVPRSDLVLFVTSADRPFTESERAFIERIRQWGKKLVLVVNKIEFLRTEAEVERVLAFIDENARRLLGFVPPTFPLSARRALEAKLAGDSGAAWEASRFAPFERHLVETLDETERVRLKLQNPLGVGRRLARRYLDAVDGRLGLLGEDFAALEDIERQLALYREDLEREFRFRLTDVDNLLHGFQRRGDAYCDETMRLPRVLDLLNKARIKADFERQVIADAPQQIEQKVGEIIDWMVAAELRQWRGITARIEQRRSEHAERLVGTVGSFDYDRERLLDTVGRAARRTIEGYDRDGESERMAAAVQTAVAETALVEVGAIGLGALVAVLTTTQLADVTGLLAAGSLAVLGLFVLPARRKRAKIELARKVQELRGKLMTALDEQFARELEGSAHRIEEAIAPYTRFVRAERSRLEERRADLAGADAHLARLASEIESL